jgi:hypothetical protein
VLLVQGAAVVAAAAVVDGATHRLAGASFGWQQPVVAVVAAAALVAPLLGAGWWLFAHEPLLRQASPAPVPAFMADAQQSPRAPRTLLLSTGPAGLSVHLSRGPGLYVGQDAVVAEPPPELADLATRLVTEPSADDVAALANAGVGYVLLSGPSATAVPAVAAVDGAPGLVRSSSGAMPGTAWELDAPAGPVRLGAAAGTPDEDRVLTGSAGSVDGVVPPGGDGGLLSLGERADAGWQATLDGDELDPRVVDGWGQGFALPATGGELVVGHDSGRGWWLAGQAVVLVLALVVVAPGRRRTDEAL